MSATAVTLMCVIIFSPGTNGDSTEKFWHEMAHCNGWEHGEKKSPGGKAFSPPAAYLHEYPYWTSPCGTDPSKGCSLSYAKSQCGGHYGCQWFKIIKKGKK